MDRLTVYTNNLISLDGRFVGRIDVDSYQSNTGRRGVTTFFTGAPGTYDQPHKISAALYIGGPSDWTINPEFVEEVARIVA